MSAVETLTAALKVLYGLDAFVPGTKLEHCTINGEPIDDDDFVAVRSLTYDDMQRLVSILALDPKVVRAARAMLDDVVDGVDW